MAGRRHRLVSARKEAGFSQERLAEVLGVERSTVMRWECETWVSSVQSACATASIRAGPLYTRWSNSMINYAICLLHEALRLMQKRDQ
jgi:transcriptional regulator with XRE-family HTH domain